MKCRKWVAIDSGLGQAQISRYSMCVFEDIWDLLKGNMEIILALSTLLLAAFTAAMALFTYRLAGSTKKLADESREASYRQIGVQTWLELSQRFDSIEMMQQRSKLAKILAAHRNNLTAFHMLLITEDVLNLFEDAGILYAENLIDKKLAASSFGFYAYRWWHASKNYVIRVRTDLNDSTLFENFEHFVEATKIPEDSAEEVNINKFLSEEYNLITNR